MGLLCSCSTRKYLLFAGCVALGERTMSFWLAACPAAHQIHLRPFSQLDRKLDPWQSWPLATEATRPERSVRMLTGLRLCRPCSWLCQRHWASSLLRTSSATATEIRWPRGRRITPRVPAPNNQGRQVQTEMQASGGCWPVFFERNWNEGSDHTFLPLHRTRASKQEEIASLRW